MKRICVLIPYYGEWPNFLPIYLKSCASNPHVSFLFFTDLIPPAEFPSNVYFHPFKFEEIKVRLNSLLGFESAITTPYKLCDVRPAYGLIFKEYITDFDFWGWGDIDLVYGNLSKFISQEMLEEIDVISFRKRWLSGSLCFIRNNHFLTNLFLQANDIRKIFATPKYMGFDEISKCWHLIREVPFEEIEWTSDNFTRLLKNAENTGLVKLQFNDHAKESIPRGDYLIWESGVLSDNQKKNYSHYHFITEKSNPYFVLPQISILSEKYFIDQAGFYSEKEFKRHSLLYIQRITKSLPEILLKYLRSKTTSLLKRISKNHNQLYAS